jgi:hypothetical protein
MVTTRPKDQINLLFSCVFCVNNRAACIDKLAMHALTGYSEQSSQLGGFPDFENYYKVLIWISVC